MDDCVKKRKDHLIGDPLCLAQLLLQTLPGRSKCSTNTRMVEPTGVEPVSKNSPTSERLQFSLSLIKTMFMA